MTLKQYRRMTVFALRMVRVTSTPRWRPALRELVADFLHRIGPNCNGDYQYMIDWDDSESFDYWDEHTWACGTKTRWHRVGTHASLCDEVDRFICDLEQQGCLPYSGEDGQKPGAQAINLTCIIRAASDVACAPSAGVLGWTAGQLRDMWKGRKLPRWVTDFFEGDITTATPDDPIWL